VSKPSQLVDFLEMLNVPTSWDPEFGVNVKDSSLACNREEMVKVMAIIPRRGTRIMSHLQLLSKSQI
jgi:hypothetical protein